MKKIIKTWKSKVEPPRTYKLFDDGSLEFKVGGELIVVGDVAYVSITEPEVGEHKRGEPLRYDFVMFGDDTVLIAEPNALKEKSAALTHTRNIMLAALAYMHELDLAKCTCECDGNEYLDEELIDSLLEEMKNNWEEEWNECHSSTGEFVANP